MRKEVKKLMVAMLGMAVLVGAGYWSPQTGKFPVDDRD